MEERIPEFVFELQDFCGKNIPIHVLEGRGYAHAFGPNDVAINYPTLRIFNEDVVLEDVTSDYEEDNEPVINSISVYNYIAENVITEKGDYWLKAIAANPEDVSNQEAYMVIVLQGDDFQNSFKIKHISVFARMAKKICGWNISMPGYATLDSHFFEMEMVPPEVRVELTKLTKGRYIPEGFSIIGKPMPTNTRMFHPNPPYSAAANSGIRNAYWDNTITVDDSNIIENIYIFTLVFPKKYNFLT